MQTMRLTMMGMCLGLLAACNIPQERFHKPDAAPDGGGGSGPLAQQAYVKASNTDANDSFGTSIALSGDGSILAVGAPGESSSATGIGGNQGDNSAPQSGAVYIYSRTNATWTLQAYLKASNAEAFDTFGRSLALSDDGATLAVGAVGEDSATTIVNGNENSNTAPFSGAAYIFKRNGATWNQEAYVKASNTRDHNYFGVNVALSGDGSTLAASATGEDSAATGIGGDQTSTSASVAGAAYVFTRVGSTWTQRDYIKASNTGEGDEFGTSLALSADGAILAVGSRFEDSAATGIDGDQGEGEAPGGGPLNTGAVYIFAHNGAAWSQQAYVKASYHSGEHNSHAGESDSFGFAVALSGDGATLAVGAYGEDSGALGTDGNQMDISANDAGAAYVFVRTGATWSQQAYIKASNTGRSDQFSFSLALSGDGSQLAVGATGEASAVFGIDGDESDNSASTAGAIYMFARSGTRWDQRTYIKASNTNAGDLFGHSVSISDDGATLAVGAPSEDSIATGINGNDADNLAASAGAVYVFRQ